MLDFSAAAIAFVIAVFILTTASHAGPGERYDVQKDETKVYSAPNAKARVVLRLNRGDRVMEWRRQGGWIKISKLNAVGKDGWVRLSRLRGEASELRIPVSQNGQYFLRANVNGKVVVFLVDTGATHVTLRPRDASALGFSKQKLAFSQRLHTAGGIVRAAPVVLDQVSIGSLSIARVSALINRAPMRISVLGMSFLGRLRGYEVRGRQLIMRW